MSLRDSLRWAILALFLLPLGFVLPSRAQTPEPRLALVLGETDYKAGRLATSVNDAGLIAETLRNAGFDVTGAANLDQDQTRRAFREFMEKASAAGPQAVVFVYLAGRGLQFEGDNYFVPVDATIARDSDVPAQALRISDLTRPLAGMPLKARMFVLDLARANNFAQGGSLAPGLALVEPEDGSLYAFNAAPGTIAPDEPGPYSAYAQALSEMMREGGLPIDDVFARTRLRVNELTRGAEVPWHASKITAPFLFFERAPGAPAPAVAVESRANIARRPVRDFPVEEAYAVALDRDTIGAYQEFLNTYPNSPLSPRVRALLAARREALIWRRVVVANTPDAYWTYMRRYPRGPHFADARRRLVMISAPLDPPPQFAFYDYDVPPPPPEEVEIIDRRRTYFFDDPSYAPPPAAPILLLAPRERDYYAPPPPPPPVSRGFLPIPVVVAPYSRPAQAPGAFTAPAFMPQPPQNSPSGFKPVQVAPGAPPQGAPSQGAPSQGAPPPAGTTPPAATQPSQPGAGQLGRPGPTGQPTPGQTLPGQTVPGQRGPGTPAPGQVTPVQPGQPGGVAPRPGPGAPAAPNALPSGNALPPGSPPSAAPPGSRPGPNARPGAPGATPGAAPPGAAAPGAAPPGARAPGGPAAPGAAPSAAPNSAAPSAPPVAPAPRQPQALPTERGPGGPAGPGAAPGGARPAAPAAAPPSAPHAAPPPAAAPKPAAPPPPPAAVAPKPAAPAPAVPHAAPPPPAAPPHAAPAPTAPPHAAPPPPAAPPHAPPPAAAPRPAPPPPAAAAPPRPAPPPPSAPAPHPGPPPGAGAPPHQGPPPGAGGPPHQGPPPGAGGGGGPHPAPSGPAAGPGKPPPCGAPGQPPCH